MTSVEKLNNYTQRRVILFHYLKQLFEVVMPPKKSLEGNRRGAWIERTILRCNITNIIVNKNFDEIEIIGNCESGITAYAGEFFFVKSRDFAILTIMLVVKKTIFSHVHNAERLHTQES
jgi:hypothetical protein